MIKKFSKLILICLFFIWPLFIVNADEINTSQKCNITIHYEYDSNPLNNVNIKIYKIANINSNNEYLYLDTYKELESDITNMSSSSINEYAIRLENYIKTNNITYDKNSITSIDGISTFNDLDVGLYLLAFDKKTANNYEYHTSPTLLTIPNYNELNNNYTYDIDMYAKVETTTINTNNDNSNKVENNKDNNQTIIDKLLSSPQTGDKIIIYFILLLLSLLGIISVVLYKKRSRKKETRDEENN